MLKSTYLFKNFFKISICKLFGIFFSDKNLVTLLLTISAISLEIMWNISSAIHLKNSFENLILSVLVFVLAIHLKKKYFWEIYLAIPSKIPLSLILEISPSISFEISLQFLTEKHSGISLKNAITCYFFLVIRRNLRCSWAYFLKISSIFS